MLAAVPESVGQRNTISRWRGDRVRPKRATRAHANPAPPDQRQGLIEAGRPGAWNLAASRPVLSFLIGFAYKPPLRESETFMAKKRKRTAWSAAHVQTLKSMAKKKTPATKIAKALKRTEGATRQKAFSIGLSLDSR